LVEIQALVTKTIFGYPQRKASGYDLNRLTILTAVLSKRAKIQLANQDVIVNVVGGLKINDPALDLAVCLSIASSLLNLPVEKNLIALGEVGLGGEVRPVKRLGDRLKAAKQLGIKKALLPTGAKINEIKPIFIKNIAEIIKILNNQ
jgi:DNA repair protein RadA/Sms